METMYVVYASTGEYEDKFDNNLFVCKSKETSHACLQAIRNWFALQGITPLENDDKYVVNKENRVRVAEEFKQQFNVFVRIDYTGIVFGAQPVKVFE